MSEAAEIVDNSNLNEALSAITEGLATDPLQQVRNKKLEHVFGYHPKGAQATFNKAVGALIRGQEVDNAKPLSILLTLSKLGLGGAEKDCLELTRELVKQGHKVSVFAQDGKLKSNLHKNVTFIERSKSRLKAARQLHKLAPEFDIVNTHDLQALLSLSLAKDSTKVLATVHNVSDERMLPVAKQVLQSVPKEVLFVSGAERTRIFGDSSNIGKVVRPGIALPTKRQVATKGNRDTMLVCGRLSHDRGPDRAIKALQFLPGIKLQLLGDGPMKQELIELANTLGVKDQVQFIPTSAEPYKYMAKAGIVMVPSREDALPRVVREAAACGKPIVASNSAGIRESAGEYTNIVYVDADDSQQLALAVLHAQMMPTGSKVAVQTGGWADIVSEIEQLGYGHKYKAKANPPTEDHSWPVTVNNCSNNTESDAQQSQFDGVDRVIGNQEKEPAQFIELRLWEQEDTYSQTSGYSGDQPGRTSSDVINITESETEREERSEWFHNEMDGSIELFPEVGREISPTGQFAIDAVSNQVDLTSNQGNNQQTIVAELQTERRYDPGHQHHTSENMMANAGVTHFKTQHGGQAPTIESTRPMFPRHSTGHSFVSESAQSNRDGIAIHGLNHSPTPEANAESEDSGDEDPKEQPVKKTNDGLLATFMAAPIAETLVGMLKDSGIKPNHLTAASTAASFAGAKAIAQPSLPMRGLGAALLISGFVLDCADGQMARLTNQCSPSGALLDELSDRGGELALIQQLAQYSGTPKFGDMAATLMLSRHTLSRLSSTQLNQKSEDSPIAGMNSGLRRLSNLTIGDRLAIVTAASVISPKLGTQTHAALGLAGLGRDVAARYIRKDKGAGLSTATAIAVTGAGLLASRKISGKVPYLTAIPYIYLAYKRYLLEQKLNKESTLPLGTPSKSKGKEAKS